jgi:hypothetical protein
MASMSALTSYPLGSRGMRSSVTITAETVPPAGSSTSATANASCSRPAAGMRSSTV